MNPIFQKTRRLSNGVEMPILGYGVWLTEENQAAESVRTAIEVGYRAIDTAEVYFNEAGVGEGIRNSGIPRDQLFVTTKVHNDSQGYDNCLRAFDISMKKLGMDYADLYLIHWPMRSTYVETWRALIRLYEEKRVRAIGVSNFHPHHIENIVKDSGVWPMVDQIEMHPRLVQPAVHSFCDAHDIAVTAYCPLMHGNLDLPLLEELGAKYGKSAAQVVLRWHIQHGNIIIPKTLKRERMISNAEILDFELTADEMAAIDALSNGTRYTDDPDNFPWDA
ncbi:MAG: aldo/keto reductase [Clostridia bacterium]|nr:aldo/keto reductase [Clostridia bacterium]